MHFIHALVNQDAHSHMLQKHLYSSPLIFELCALMCVKKSQMAGDDATHVGWLIGYCMRVPLVSGTGAQEEDETRQLVASVAAAAVYVCGFSSPRYVRARLGSAHLRGNSLDPTREFRGIPFPSPPSPSPPPWVFGFINTLRRSQSVPDISAKAEASSPPSFLWVKNSRERSARRSRVVGESLGSI